jgi:hypothetical protein
MFRGGSVRCSRPTNRRRADVLTCARFGSRALEARSTRPGQPDRAYELFERALFLRLQDEKSRDEAEGPQESRPSSPR